MAGVTYPYRQRSPASNRQRRLSRAVARAIEIQLPIAATKADWSLYRIFILPIGAIADEPHRNQVRAGSTSFADEEPTWEDAEWQ
jgi:hypothetical protein